MIEVFARNAFGIMASYSWDVTARALALGHTQFAYDTSLMIAGVLFMVAAGYSLMRGVHIRADFLYRNWSNKTQATVDATLYMAFLIPSILFFLRSLPRNIGRSLTGQVRLLLTAHGSHFFGPVARRCRLAAFCLYYKAFQNCSASFKKWAKSPNTISFWRCWRI